MTKTKTKKLSFKLTLIALKLSALLIAQAVTAQTSPNSENEDSSPTAETQPEQTSSDENANDAQQSPTEDREFRPSEEISEDRPVSFPVDI